MTDLSPDRPSVDPKEDLFGHAPFARSLADSICRYPGDDGLVLALYGPWGSGKSTTLEYVCHYLDEQDESERPIVVTFNPWWFSGQELPAEEKDRAIIEVVFVVGKNPDEPSERVENAMNSVAPGSRIVTYDLLIDRASQSYAEYIHKADQVDRIETMLGDLGGESKCEE